MADSWQTIEQAAVSLRLSVRTVNRHIAAGKLQSRLTSEGRREVFVSLPDVPAGETEAGDSAPFATAGAAFIPGAESSTSTAPPTAAPIGAPQEFSTHSPSGSAYTPIPGVSVDPETVLALADNAAEKAEMAVAAYQALARVADQQATQVRRNARFAWTAVAVMAAGITGAVGYTSYKWTRMTDEADTRLTRATADVDHLKQQVDTSAKAIDQLKTERDTIRTELTAKQDALRTELDTARNERATAEGRLAAYREQEDARQAREATLAATASAAAAAAKAASAAATAATSQPTVIVQRPAPAPAPVSSDTSAKPDHGQKQTARAAQASWKTPGREFRPIDASVPGLTTPLTGQGASDEDAIGANAAGPTTRPATPALSGKAVPTTTRAPSPSDTSSASTASEQQPR
jgi:hypothetical protein